MKTNILKKVSQNKIGKLNKNGMRLEPNEVATFECLTLFGFNIEIVRPTSVRGMKNPDAVITGTMWEVKTPTSSKYYTIRNRFREASKQATRIVFDLRFIKENSQKVEKQIIELFKNSSEVRRLIIIENSEKAIDISK